MDDADKATIVNQVLERYTVWYKKYGVPDPRLKGEVILSTKNINPQWVKPLEDPLKLRLINEDEIKQNEKEQGDVFYHSFNKFNVQGDCLIVDFDRDNLNRNHRNGWGMSFIYRKEAGKLVSQFTSGWER